MQYTGLGLCTLKNIMYVLTVFRITSTSCDICLPVCVTWTKRHVTQLFGKAFTLIPSRSIDFLFVSLIYIVRSLLMCFLHCFAGVVRYFICLRASALVHETHPCVLCRNGTTIGCSGMRATLTASSTYTFRRPNSGVQTSLSLTSRNSCVHSFHHRIVNVFIWLTFLLVLELYVLNSHFNLCLLFCVVWCTNVRFL